MRYIDELLALYQGKDAFTRKFVLAQLIDQPPDGFTDQVVELLWSESRDLDAIVRRQARYSLGQYLPAHAAYLHGLSGEAPPPGTKGRARAAATVLATVLARVLAILDSGSATERVAASLVLGRIHAPDTIATLMNGVRGAELSYMAAFAVAEVGEEAAVEALVAAADQHGKTRTDVFMLLRGLPCAATRECLERNEEQTDPSGRANIALALAQFSAADARPQLERLIRRREGWVSAYALDTLAGHGDPEDLPLVRLAYELEQHEFIRAQAIRAAGGIRSAAARAFCEEVLASGAPRVQAAALEALLAQEVPADELARIAEPHLGSEFPRTQVQALLAVSRADPDRGTEALGKMVLAREALWRVEGAWMIGLLAPPGGVPLLERMALTDPSTGVRVQAIRSIANYSVEQAVPVLVRMLEVPQRPVLMAASRALCGIENADTVALALAKAAPHVKQPACQSALLRALGIASRRAGHPPPAALLDALEDPDAVVKLGALEGLKYFGDEIPLERVRPLVGHADPRLAARAAMAHFVGGQPQEASSLEPLLDGTDEARSLEALGALLEMAAIVPHLERGAFKKLSEALAEPSPAAAPKRAGTSKTRTVPSLRKTGLLAELSGAGPATLSGKVSSKSLDEVAGKYSQKTSAEMTGDSQILIRMPSVGAAAPRPTPAAGAAAVGSDAAVQNRLIEGVDGGPTAARAALRAGSAQKSRVLMPAGTEASAAGGAAGLRRAGLVMVAVALGVVGGVFARLGGSGEVGEPARVAASAAAVQRTALRVWSVQGACGRLGADGKPQPLPVGAWVKPGETLLTEASGRLQVRYHDGTAVHLGPASRVVSGGATERSDHAALPAVKLDGANGDLTLESKSTELQVALGAAVYRMQSGRAHLLAGGPQGKVEQLEGDGTLVKGNVRTVLVAGQSASLSP